MGQSSSSNDISPGSLRPKKRCRPEPEDFPPGFGFIGFTSRSGEGAATGPSVLDGSEGNLDLNVRASSEDCSVGDPVGVAVPIGGGDVQGGLNRI
ncbi:hypothetical protein Hanom_Chr14g01325051 [Helianthus anomalus]